MKHLPETCSGGVLANNPLHRSAANEGDSVMQILAPGERRR
jgi:hypothetical protein